MLHRKSNYVLMLKGVRVESKFPLALLEKCLDTLLLFGLYIL